MCKMWLEMDFVGHSPADASLNLAFQASMQSIAVTCLCVASTTFSPPVIFESPLRTCHTNAQTIVGTEKLKHSESILRPTKYLWFKNIMDAFAGQNVPAHRFTTNWPSIVHFVTMYFIFLTLFCSRSSDRLWLQSLSFFMQTSSFHGT